MSSESLPPAPKPAVGTPKPKHITDKDVEPILAELKEKDKHAKAAPASSAGKRLSADLEIAGKNIREHLAGETAKDLPLTLDDVRAALDTIRASKKQPDARSVQFAENLRQTAQVRISKLLKKTSEPVNGETIEPILAELKNNDAKAKESAVGRRLESDFENAGIKLRELLGKGIQLTRGDVETAWIAMRDSMKRKPENIYSDFSEKLRQAAEARKGELLKKAAEAVTKENVESILTELGGSDANTKHLKKAKEKIQEHLTEGRHITRADVETAFNELRVSEETQKYKVFAKRLVEVANVRVEALRTNLINEAHAGAEGPHLIKSNEISHKARGAKLQLEAENKMLLQQHNDILNACNNHFSEALSAEKMPANKLVNLKGTTLQRLAAEHYNYLCSLEILVAEELAHYSGIAEEAVKEGKYPEAGRIAEIIKSAKMPPVAPIEKAAVPGRISEPIPKEPLIPSKLPTSRRLSHPELYPILDGLNNGKPPVEAPYTGTHELVHVPKEPMPLREELPINPRLGNKSPLAPLSALADELRKKEPAKPVSTPTDPVHESTSTSALVVAGENAETSLAVMEKERPTVRILSITPNPPAKPPVLALPPKGGEPPLPPKEDLPPPPKPPKPKPASSGSYYSGGSLGGYGSFSDPVPAATRKTSPAAGRVAKKAGGFVERLRIGKNPEAVLAAAGVGVFLLLDDNKSNASKSEAFSKVEDVELGTAGRPAQLGIEDTAATAAEIV